MISPDFSNFPYLRNMQVITENMFTDPNNQTRTGNESPISIGEALDGSMHQRTTSNPFMPPSPSGKGKEKWDEEKTQVSMQMTMLKEQLDGEKAARIQSEVRREREEGRASGRREREKGGRGEKAAWWVSTCGRERMGEMVRKVECINFMM